MEEFVNFYNEIKEDKSLALNIYNAENLNWCINIGYRFEHPKHGRNVVEVEDLDPKLAFAIAYVELKKWVKSNANGSYECNALITRY